MSVMRTSLGPADAAEAARLHAACMRDPWSEETFAALLAESSMRGSGYACADAGLVGLLLMRILPGEAEIYTVAVLPERRRSGLARALLRSGLAEAATQGVEAVFLEVGARNEPALALYRHLGFREVGRRAGYYRTPAPEDAIVMRADPGGSPPAH